MTEHYDALETRDPAEREADLFARLPDVLRKAMAAPAYAERLGGFDPVYRAAGDDVDICWRFQDAGHVIGFSPAAIVWHFRRNTVKAYCNQQRGYGKAEALVYSKHPFRFNLFGQAKWLGRIYGDLSTSLLLSRRDAAPLAYISGSMGTLIGADLTNLDKVAGLGAPVASIGGAGTFDGIFLTGILAVLLAGLYRPSRPVVQPWA